MAKLLNYLITFDQKGRSLKNVYRKLLHFYNQNNRPSTNEQVF